MPEISSSELSDALLQSITRRIHRYSIVLIALLRRPGHPVEAEPMGSGTLITVEGQSGILTAHHVARQLGPDSKLALTVAPENEEHSFEIPRPHLTILEIAVPETSEYGPDISFIGIPSAYLGRMKATKAFLDLGYDRESLLSQPPPLESGIWLVCGAPSRRARPVPSERGYPEVYEFEQICGTAPATRAYARGSYDYIEQQTDFQSANNVLESFRGMSGGGVWQVLLQRSDTGDVEPVRFLLSGLVFFQSELRAGRRFLRSHGRHSIYQTAYEAIKAKCA